MSLSASARELLAVPAGNLAVSEAVVLDWYDGPLEGFLRFDVPPTTWQFKLFAERAENEAPDDRLFLLSEVPVGLWKKLIAALAGKENTEAATQIPSWQFATPAARAAADEAVAQLERSCRPAELLVRLSGSMTISHMWTVRAETVGCSHDPAPAGS
jgi:hypothetical protein